MGTLEQALLARAHELGFELAGIAPATEADGFDRLRDWLPHDFAGEMAYMQRHADAPRHPASVLSAVRSVVMVGMNYHPAPASGGCEPPGASGRVASYARGSADYHDVLRERLNQL